MTSERADSPDEKTIDLKDPVLAGFLAWLVPGLGHWYQGRRPKAILFFVCIMGLWGYGVYLSSSREACVDRKYLDVRPDSLAGNEGTIGCGRAVYFSLRDGDRQIRRLCQLGIGLPTLPVLLQAHRMNSGRKVFWGGFLAPPRLLAPRDNARAAPNLDQPTPQDLHYCLHRYFELATFFTMMAGLLNVLAIYDAVAGPVPVAPPVEPKKDNNPEPANDARKKS